MAGDCTHTSYVKTETFCPSERWSGDVDVGDGEMEKVEDSKRRGTLKPWPPRFEIRNGLLYRKKLERGFIHYREVLDEDRRHEAIGTIHRRQLSDQHHLSLEETYKCVAENYWWEGMNIPIYSWMIWLDDLFINPRLVQKTSLQTCKILPEYCIYFHLCVTFWQACTSKLEILFLAVQNVRVGTPRQR